MKFIFFILQVFFLLTLLFFTQIRVYIAKFALFCANNQSGVSLSFFFSWMHKTCNPFANFLVDYANFFVNST